MKLKPAGKAKRVYSIGFWAWAAAHTFATLAAVVRPFKPGPLVTWDGNLVFGAIMWATMFSCVWTFWGSVNRGGRNRWAGAAEQIGRL